jgi:RecB family exonuclease
MPLYSYSRIGCFETCPRQYKFRYIEKPDIVKPEGVEAFLGKMVHEALEKCYKLVRHEKVLSAEELIVLFKRLWDEKLPDNLKIVREEMTLEDYFKIGKKSLEMYHARYAPFDQELTIGLEQRLNFSLDPEGKYKMTGFIDRLSRDGGGRLRIQDYKTSGNLPTQQQIDADNQLALYQIAVEEMWPDNNGIELVWHYTQFDTTLVSHRDRDQLEELRQTYIDKIKTIERSVELGNFETNETSLCDWCEYYELCPAKGGSGVPATEQTTISITSEEEQKQLVDEYVELNADKKKLEKRLGEIKDALIQCGDTGTSKFLDGTGDMGVLVTIKNIAKLPTKSSDEATYNKIRQVVEKAGFYPQYSALDVRSLQKDLTDGKLIAELDAELRKFEEPATQSTVRTKKVV